MNTSNYILLFFCFFLTGIFAQTKQEKKDQKTASKIQEYEKAKELIGTKSFEYEADWATSQKGKRISLIGNSNYLRIKGDSIFAFLPYFGVRHSGGGYDGGGGIEINNILKSYTVSYNDKKKKIEIKISARGKSEYFDLLLTVFGGGNGGVYVSSSSRSSITYHGTFSVLKEKETKEE